jgi:acyl-CoA thioesterase YciA
MPDTTNKADILPDEIKNRTPTLRLTPMPSDTNALGKIFGGWLMSQMDLAASDRARERAGAGLDVVTRQATTSFEKPIEVGDMVAFYTEVGRVGTTSVAIKIDVWAQRRISRIYEKVASGEYVFVAIDKNKNKAAIGPVRTPKP